MGNTVRIRNGMENATEGDILGSASDIIKDLGVVDLAGGHLLVTQNSPLGMSVQVAGGVVYVPNSNYSILDSDTPKFYPVVCSNEVLAVDNNVSGSTRYDIVCVKIDKVIVPDPDASNVATKVVIKGTPGAGVPATPANHYKLAEIKVVNGETEITNAEITDKRTQVCFNNTLMSGFPVSILNEIKAIDTTTFDAFGVLVKTDEDNAIYFFRQGSSHVGDKGKIVAQKYNFSTQRWGTRWDVYEDINVNYDVRNVAGGIIGNKIYLFFSRYNISTSKLQDMGYIISTDSTGVLWSGYTTINTGFYWGSPYGALIDTNTLGKYLVPIYGDNGSGTYYIKFFETEDFGATWHIGDTIYSGTSSFTEACVAHLGNGNMIALMRINTGGLVYQSKSTDNGVTWSSPSITNMGEPVGVKIPWVYYSKRANSLIAIFKDRSGLCPIKIYIVNADKALTTNFAWEYVRLSDDDLNLSSDGEGGYPSMVSISDDKFLYVFYDSPRGPHSDADTYMGILNLGMLNKQDRQDGWTELIETWTYVSSKEFTVYERKDLKFELADKIRWYQSGWKYAYIVKKTYSSETNLTTITIAGDSITNNPIYLPHMSRLESPLGFPQWFSYTPDVGAGAGTFTSVSAIGKFRLVGRMCFVSASVYITTNGTAANYTMIGIPITSTSQSNLEVAYPFFGREGLVTGKALGGLVTSQRPNHIFVRDYSNAYCGDNGYQLNVSGWYEILI